MHTNGLQFIVYHSLPSTLYIQSLFWITMMAGRLRGRVMSSNCTVGKIFFFLLKSRHSIFDCVMPTLCLLLLLLSYQHFSVTKLHAVLQGALERVPLPSSNKGDTQMYSGRA